MNIDEMELKLKENLEKIEKRIAEEIGAEDDSIRDSKKLKENFKALSDYELYSNMKNKKILLNFVEKIADSLKLDKKIYLDVLKQANKICENTIRKIGLPLNLKEEELVYLLKQKTRMKPLEKGKNRLLELMNSQINKIIKHKKKEFEDKISAATKNYYAWLTEIEELIIDGKEIQEEIKDKLDLIKNASIDEKNLEPWMIFSCNLANIFGKEKIISKAMQMKKFEERKTELKKELDELNENLKKTSQEIEKKIEMFASGVRLVKEEKQTKMPPIGEYKPAFAGVR